MKKSIVIFFFLLTNFTLAQSGWFSLTNSSPADLFDIYFVNSTTGIVAGGTLTYGLILRTTNSGVSWDSIDVPSNGNMFRDLEFTDANTGYAVGNGGVIIKTTNAGANWTALVSGTTQNLRCISFYPSGTGATGMASGFNGTILKTVNAGANWTVLNTGLTTETLYSIQYVDGNIAYAVGGTQSNVHTIIKTTNGGTNWLPQSAGLNNLLRGVFFQDVNTGYAVGDNGNIIKTTNGGSNWQILAGGVTNSLLRDIYFVNSTTGYIAAGFAKIYKTTNSGVNWIQQNTTATQDLQSVYFQNSSTGYIVGNKGVILKTVNGGVGVRKVSSEVPQSFSLNQNYPNPFNPTTEITFNISQAGFVLLKIFDLKGKEISNLINEKIIPGSYSMNFNASGLSSGVYYYRLTVNEYSETKKMVLIK